MSEPMTTFLDHSDKAHVRGKAGFALCTKVEHRFARSAGKRIEKKRGELGMNVVRPRAFVFIVEREGPLKERIDELLQEGPPHT
jgi:hypothetical protein